MKPQGKVTCVRLISKPPVNDVAASAQVVCVDETGRQFVFSATCFNMELKPYCEQQELSFNDWRRSIGNLDRWLHINWHTVDLDAEYRSGLSPQQCYDKYKRY